MGFTPEAKRLCRESVLPTLEAAFKAGNKFAVFQALLIAAAGRNAPPEWARLALRSIERGINSGRIADLNEAFGWRDSGGGHKSTRMAQARYRRYSSEIMNLLVRERAAGRGMTPVTFEAIAEEIGVGRSLVQEVWNRRRAEILRTVEFLDDQSGGKRGWTNAVLVFDYWDE